MATRSAWRVFAWPIVIAVLSTIGLVSALTGNGYFDLVSWIALAVPPLAVGWAMRARRN